MSAKERQRAKKQEALARTRAFLASQGVVESIIRPEPKEATRERLMRWISALGPVAEPQLREMVGGGPLAWHVDLGEFPSASFEVRGEWDLCYGKGRSCLADGPGETTCVEVEVGRRLQRDGWEAGWWNNYADRRGLGSKDGPLAWQDAEVDRKALRELALRALPRLASLLTAGSGIADVIAWSGTDVIAAECKRVSRPSPDTVSPSQAGWAEGFMRKFGVGSYAVIEWRSRDG